MLSGEVRTSVNSLLQSVGQELPLTGERASG